MKRIYKLTDCALDDGGCEARRGQAEGRDAQAEEDATKRPHDTTSGVAKGIGHNEPTKGATNEQPKVNWHSVTR